MNENLETFNYAKTKGIFYGGQLKDAYPRDICFKLVVSIVVIDVLNVIAHMRTIDMSFSHVQD